MPALSGKDGNVKIGGFGGTDVADITNWKWDRTSNNPAYASSDSGGFKKRVKGVTDNSGTFECVAQDSSDGTLPLVVGASLELLLETGSGNQAYEVPAVVDKVSLEVDPDDGSLVKYTVDFSGNGTWTANPSS